MTARGLVSRVLYGLLFAVAIPVAMAWWATATAGAVNLPCLRNGLGGAALIAVGAALMAAGGLGLVVIGRGLPMNAFPPPRLVQSGIFRWFANPMYLGFVLVSAGVSIAVGSAAGLWLVTPVTALAVTALVLGYERHDLGRRFGPAGLTEVGLSLPPDEDRPPTPRDRIAVIVRVLIPWLIIYAAVQQLGRAPDAFGTSTTWERGWPVVQWTEAIYASTYLFVPLTVLIETTQRRLRAFAVEGAIGTALVAFCWLVIPVVATNRPFEPAGIWGRLLAYEQGHSNGVAAFPAFHVLWALIAGASWASADRPVRRAAGIVWAVAIIVSCLTTSMHSLAEVAAAIVIYPPIRYYRQTWRLIRQATESLANSWREWRIGPVRIINHGVYAALAAGAGLLIAGSAAGPGSFNAVIGVGIGVLIGAGTWAQWLEGSSRLLRPFGWYGGVLGGVMGATAAWVLGTPLVPLLAAYAIAAPWIQSLGRLRCLVQGCCHGGPAPEPIGIRYRHRRSRVTQLAGLADVPIHPTPLYSIAGNIVIGILVFRLRILGGNDSLILGVYLILGGLARFVEESYRAEPQTRMIGGLHIYQWMAMASVAAGIGCTTARSAATVPPFSQPDARLVAAAVVMAILTGFAMGVDFPGSNRRFSRLAAADD